MIFGEMLLKLAITIGFVAAIIILNFSLFSVGIKHNHRQIAILALVVGTANFYFKFFLEAPFFMIVQTFVYMIMLMVLRRYPLLYAFIVSVIGSLCVTVIDIIITVSALNMGLSTLELMANNIYHYTFFHILTAAGLLLLALVIHKFKLSFSFIVRRFKGKCLNFTDMAWGVILNITLTVLTITTIKLPNYSMHFFLLMILSISLIGVLYYAYIQNRKIVRYRFGEGADKDDVSR